eukprot:SAG22_NODE_11051_length_503_cov_0.806931_1_plen_91_part_01
MPEDPTASAFLDRRELVLGASSWHWSSGGKWVESPAEIEHGAAAAVAAGMAGMAAAAAPTVLTLQVVSCPVEAYSGFYSYVDEVNDHGHWA